MTKRQASSLRKAPTVLAVLDSRNEYHREAAVRIFSRDEMHMGAAFMYGNDDTHYPIPAAGSQVVH